MHFVIVHESGETAAAEIFADRQSARAGFKSITSGVAALYELRRSQAVKRVNFDISHSDSKDSLSKMNEKQLRAEAKKRNLAIHGNPQATPSDIISEIQQDELTKRVAHRRPLTSDVKKAPVPPVSKPPVAANA